MIPSVKKIALVRFSDRLRGFEGDVQRDSLYEVLVTASSSPCGVFVKKIPKVIDRTDRTVEKGGICRDFVRSVGHSGVDHRRSAIDRLCV